MLDPAALVKIKSLELRAQVIVEGFWSGLHRSPYHGFSVEFSEYRPYAAGDDLRHVDWRVYARSDRYFIKKFEDETNLRCLLLVDRSRSMEFGSGPMTKADYAATLGATLAYFLHGQGDAAGVMTFAEGIEAYLPPRHRPGHLRHLMLTLERRPERGGTELAEPLRRAAELQRKRGLFVLISDLLAPIDLLESRLAYLRARGNEVSVFHVLDPRELDLDLGKPVFLEDLESGREMFVDPSAVADDYRRALGEHTAAVERLCGRRGIDYRRLATDQPIEGALHGFLSDRIRAAAGGGARARRTRAPAKGGAA